MRTLNLFLMTLMILGHAGRARADVVTWVGPATGEWGTDSNWSPHPPSAGDDVVIPSGAAVTFSGFGADRTVRSIAGDGGLEIVQGTLRVTETITLGSTRIRNSFAALVGATMQSDLVFGPDSSGGDGGTLDGVTIAAGATLRPGLRNTFDGIRLNIHNGLVVDGEFLVGNPSRRSRIHFEGTQELSGQGHVRLRHYSIDASSGNVLRPSAYDTLTIASSITIHNRWRGTIGWENGSVAGERGTVINHALIRTDSIGAETMLQGNFINEGVIVAEATGSRVTLVQLLGNCLNRGRMIAEGPGSKIDLNGVMVNEGELEIGKDARVNSTKAFVQAAAGILDVFVGGTQPSELGILSSTDSSGATVSIQGTLRATVQPLYTPAGDERFRVVTYNQKVFPGLFTNLDLPSHWYPDYGSQPGVPKQYVELRLRSGANPPTDAEDHGGEVLSTRVSGGLPNPFRSATMLRYSVGREAAVRLIVVDARGRVVRRLWEGTKVPGMYQVPWDGRDDQGSPLPSGVYAYSMDVDGQRSTSKVVLLR